jgi:hypothetical protein
MVENTTRKAGILQEFRGILPRPGRSLPPLDPG